MMNILVLLASIQMATAEIPKPTAEVWGIGKTYYTFKKDKVTGALLSRNCLPKKANCLAYNAVVSKSKVKLTEADLQGGKNPGAVTCKKVYDSEVLILRNAANSESAFCKFKDKTIVSVSDL